MYKNKIKFPNKCSFCLLYKLLVLFVALFGGGFIVLLISLLNLKTSFNLSPEHLQADVFICILFPVRNQGQMLSVFKKLNNKRKYYLNSRGRNLAGWDLFFSLPLTCSHTSATMWALWIFLQKNKSYWNFQTQSLHAFIHLSWFVSPRFITA